MGQDKSKGLRLGFSVFIVGFSAGQSIGQSPISLQPLAPVSPGSLTQPRTLQPPPSMATGSGPIVLERINQAPKNVPAQSVASPIKVLPMRQDPKTPPVETPIRRGRLDVNQMIRTPVDLQAVFSKINIDSSSSHPALAASAVRVSDSNGFGEYEWTPNGYCWQSPAFCYSPLYFEQPNLERYGNGALPLFAPAVSAAYFFGQVTTLPFKAIHQPPWSTSCTLGHHRPGDCAPFQRPSPKHVQSPQAVPISNRAPTTIYTEVPQSLYSEVQGLMPSMVQGNPPLQQPLLIPGTEPVIVRISE